MQNPYGYNPHAQQQHAYQAQQPYGAPAGQQWPQAQAQQHGLPQIHMPTDDAIAAAYAKAQEDQARVARARAGQFGDRTARFFKPLGPNREEKWDAVPVGYEARYLIWLCGGWAPGAPFYVEDPSHFFFSQAKPQGDSVGCGRDHCFVCAARSSLFRSGSEADAQLAKSKGRVQMRALYQFLLIEHPQSHVGADGKMTPWLFRAPSTLHNDIVAKIKEKTATRIFHPEHGRPLILKKRKTGVEKTKIEWSIDDLDPQPLHPWFYPALSNLWDLSKFAKPPTLREQFEAIQKLGFPMPHELPLLAQQEAAAQQQGQQPGYGQQQVQQYGQQHGYQPSYSPHASPPGPSPYGQPQPQPQYGSQWPSQQGLIDLHGRMRG